MVRKPLKVRSLAPIVLLALVAGCAASPLYSDKNRGNWTVGGIPRDARGEPVWAAIPPVPGQRQTALNQPPAAAQAAAAAAVEEGDAEEYPTPRTR